MYTSFHMGTKATLAVRKGLSSIIFTGTGLFRFLGFGKLPMLSHSQVFYHTEEELLICYNLYIYFNTFKFFLFKFFK